MNPLPSNDAYIWIPVIAAIGGSFVSGTILLINNWINKRSEERRHLNEITLNIALENWKQICNSAIERARLNPTRKISVLPFETSMIYIMKLTNVLFSGNVTRDNVVSKLKEVREISDEVTKFILSEETNAKAKDGSKDVLP